MAPDQSGDIIIAATKFDGFFQPMLAERARMITLIARMERLLLHMEGLGVSQYGFVPCRV
jgi:hypothetical protein